MAHLGNVFHFFQRLGDKIYLQKIVENSKPNLTTAQIFFKKHWVVQNHQLPRKLSKDSKSYSQMMIGVDPITETKRIVLL